MVCNVVFCMSSADKGSNSNMALPSVSVLAINTNTAMMFKTNPHLAISITLIYPYEKMTAFGGVATGNIKANDDAMAAGSMMYRGSAFIVNARSPKMGRNNAHVAALLVTSVTAAIIKHIARTRLTDSKWCNALSCELIHAERPDSCEALAMEYPPPSKNTMPQGIFVEKIFQLRSGLAPAFLSESSDEKIFNTDDGKMNREHPTSNPGTESRINLSLNVCAQP